MWFRYANSNETILPTATPTKTEQPPRDLRCNALPCRIRSRFAAPLQRAGNFGFDFIRELARLAALKLFSEFLTSSIHYLHAIHGNREQVG